MSRFTVLTSLLLCSTAPLIHAQVQCSTANLRGLYSGVCSDSATRRPISS
jgi:hypothetical protein